MILPEAPDFFQIACDTKLRIAELRWDQYTNFAAFQDNYQQLLQFMEMHQLNCAIIDIRGRGEVPYADQIWLCRELLPDLITKVKKTVKLAYVLNTEHFAALQSESPNGDMETYSDLLKMQFFLDVPTARNWLKVI